MQFKNGFVIGLSILVLSISAQASEINVGGVVWDPDSMFDFTSNHSLVEDQLDFKAGNTQLSGFGTTSMVNQLTSFCPGCELTFQFGGFEFLGQNAADPTQIAFTGGWINFYIDKSADYTATSYASAGSEGGTNALFMRLEAHEVFNAAFGENVSIVSNTTSFGEGTDAGSGNSLMDVVAGLAFGNFDTNEQTDGADFVFSSSFQPIPSGGNGEGYELFGTADLRGNSIPEPTSIALLGLGLLGFAASRKHKA
ncbi:PEP-CTERM sorting domain-containing protein [Colwelliaceae bacterium 6441]